MRLEKTLTIITGGAGLIGRHYIRGILTEGGKCVIADIDAQRAQSLQESLGKEFNQKNFLFYPLDITSQESIQGLIEATTHYFHQPITGLVNNAYPKTPDYGKDFFEVEYQTLCDNLNLHLGGYFLCSKILAQYFQKNGGGNIINTASIYGVVPPRFEIYKGTKITVSPEYAMIKSAVIFLTEFMAKRFKGMGIRVNCLSPGGILDEQDERFLAAYREQCSSKGMLNPQDLVGTLTYLLSPESQFVNGQNIVVDDGFTL